MSMPRMKLKQLEIALESVDPFEKPKARLEQYTTSAHLAASILFDIQTRNDSICGKKVADLGCGTGKFTIGSSLLDASVCIGFDIDPDAISVMQSSITEMGLDESPIDMVLCDVRQLEDIECGRWIKSFDTVIMNPPFGTSKANEGIDLVFLKAGLTMATTNVYSLHKSSTTDFVMKKARQWGAESQVVSQLHFDIPRMYSRHKKDSIDIAVDLVHSWFKNNN